MKIKSSKENVLIVMKKFRVFGNNLKFIIVVSIFFIVPATSAYVVINEVMYNPFGDDNNREYIEIYSNESINLTNWIIADNSSNDSLINLQYYNSSYALIVEQDFNYSGINASIYSAGSTIGNKLNNDNDSIYLYYIENNNSILVNSANYNFSIGANGDNNSLQLCNQSWIANPPTPGYQNNCTQQIPEDEPPPQNQTNQSNQNQTESYINIIDASNNAEFGDKIEIEFEVYKGDTSKYAVYIYIEDENEKRITEKTTLHLRTKFTNYSLMAEINLPCINKSDYYYAVVEGLDTEDKEKIKINSCKNTAPQQNDENYNDFSCNITIPSIIKTNEEFFVKVKIINNLNAEQNFSIWSYVYRGSKCYSCFENEARESNAKTINVNSNSYAEIELKNKVYDAESGNYSLKIKILKGNTRTPKEYTYSILIESLNETESQTISDSYSIKNQKIIESKSQKIAKSSLYMFATVLMLFIIYIIINKSQ